MGKLVSISINMDVYPTKWVANEEKYRRVSNVHLLSDEDTYIAGVGGTTKQETLKLLRKEVNVLYESPLTMNYYHSERSTPSQQIIIFEKKCPVTSLEP